MSDLPKLEELLSHRPPGRILNADGIGAEFALIRCAWEATGKPVPTASDFEFVARGSGTHLLKLASPRAPAGQSVLRVVPAGPNQHPDLIPSIDAKKAPVAKIVFRPLEVLGRAPKHLVDHILNPDDLTPTVLKGFSSAFGKGALKALQEGLTKPLSAVARLPVAEFPIVFLPRPGGGDLQATPLAPAEAYVRMGEVTAPYFLKREEGRPPPPRGRWHHQEVSAQPQNISGAIGKRRTRFLARMPQVLDRWEADLHRYARSGEFPLWRDNAVVDAVEAYADLLDRIRTYSNQAIRQGLDRRADGLIRAARSFIAEAVADARLSFPDAELRDPLSITDVILRRRWKGEGFDRARRVLTDDHFKERLQKSQEA